jgi:hypothetical protein
MRLNTLATNGARFDHLMGLALGLEKNAHRYNTQKRLRALKLAAIYRDMAFEAMPSAVAVRELNLTDRSRLAAKLRRMTVENGCTEAEADNAAQLLLRLESGE